MLNRSSAPVRILLISIVAFFVIGASYAYETFQEKRALQWRTLNDQNSLQARHENAYVEANGKFYLMGGRGSRRVEIYDPADSTWTTGSLPPDNMQLHHFQAVAIGDTIYIVSAYTDTFPDENAVEEVLKYAVNTDTWVVGSTIPASRRRGSGGAVHYNGKIYLVGGSTGGHGGSAVRKNQFDEYDPVTDTWTTLPSAPFARDHVHAAVVGNKLYVIGGRNGSNGDNVEEVDVYDFNAGSWSTLPGASDFPIPRAGASSVAVGNYVVVIGGESTRDLAHDEVHALNTLTNDWVTMDPLGVGRHGTQAIFYNDNIYIASGSGMKGGTPELTSHEVFETEGETVLPVELAPGFAATINNNDVTLNWRTLSETNNAGFEVEQYKDGVFTALGFVRGAGTTTEAQDYQFNVGEQPPGRHVFRLKQIDFDGTFAYSPQAVALIHTASAAHLGAVYPNPLNPEGRFTLTLAQTQDVTIGLYDLLGRQISVIYNGQLEGALAHTFALDASALAGGKYLVVAEGRQFSVSKPFTVLK
ncbi:MAG: kelch repeat-containing protein [Bacteroidota bacterium]